MGFTEMTRSHVKECLREGLGLCGLQADDDGDIPLQWENIPHWVSMRTDGQRARARVWSVVATDVAPRMAVLRELNAYQRRLDRTRLLLRDRQIRVEGTVDVASLTPESMADLCFEVASTAKELGEVLSVFFGLHCPYVEEVVLDEPED